MSKRDQFLLIGDMLSSALKIKDYTKDLDINSFLIDNKTMDAVARNFEIIGEAANILDEEFRSGYPKIEWRRIRGFRNRIIHDYFGIDYKIVWSIIEKDLDELIHALQNIVNDDKRDV